ncbi:MAG TPA: hypothetical protein VK894_07060 [Jiangellales bacterium]|nr:hypothetical protein [Jiangellales bacterium]
MANPFTVLVQRADTALNGRARINAAYALAADRRRARDWRDALVEVDAALDRRVPRPA